MALRGAFSQWSTLKACLSQGSIFGILLIFIYINDIVLNINSSIRLCAVLYIIVKNQVQSSVVSNSNLSQVYTRASY